MDRGTKFLAAAVMVVAFSGVVAAGAVGYRDFDAGPGTTLCHDRGGVVRIADGTNCPPKTTPFVVANQAQIDATETAINELVENLAGDLSSLTIEADYIEGADNDRWEVSVHGFGLVPGSPVVVTYEGLFGWEDSRSYVVADDGTVNEVVLNPEEGVWTCRTYDFIATGTSLIYDLPVVSEAVTPSGTRC